MGYRVGEGGNKFVPEYNQDGDAAKSQAPDKAAKKAEVGGEKSVADKKAQGLPTGDEVVTGQAPPPQIPQNLQGGTPPPPDDVQNVSGAQNKTVDFKNAMMMMEAVADMSFVLRDIKDTKREDSLADLKEVEKDIADKTKDLERFNEKFEEVAGLLIQEFAAGRDEPQFCKQQMGPQDQNPELMRLLTEKLGISPTEASDMLNGVREGNSSAMATAIGLAALIAMAEVRDEGDLTKDPADPNTPTDPNAPVPDATTATTDHPTTEGVQAATDSDQQFIEESGFVGNSEPSPGLVANTDAALSMQGLTELFPGGAENQQAVDPNAPLSNEQVMGAAVQAGFSVPELIGMAGLPPEQIMAAIKDNNQQALNELKAKLGKMIREMVTATVAAKAMELSMKVTKQRIQQVFKPQLEQQPTRRIN